MAIIGLITVFTLPNFSKIQTKAKENNLKSTLHTLQIAIEGYASNNGAYPTGKDLTFVQLLDLLRTSGELNQTPKNPFTGQTYTGSETSGKITYTLDGTTNVYTLTGFGAGNTTEVLKLQNI
jgi:type II secretory pathway pseudopilin PulG